MSVFVYKQAFSFVILVFVKQVKLPAWSLLELKNKSGVHIHRNNLSNSVQKSVSIIESQFHQYIGLLLTHKKIPKSEISQTHLSWEFLSDLSSFSVLPSLDVTYSSLYKEFLCLNCQIFLWTGYPVFCHFGCCFLKYSSMPASYIHTCSKYLPFHALKHFSNWQQQIPPSFSRIFEQKKSYTQK